MIIVWIWLGNVIYVATVVSAALLWAVRNRQFSDMDRPRHFALNAADELNDQSQANRRPGRLDRYIWLFMLIVTAAVFATALWIGIRTSPGVKPWNS